MADSFDLKTHVRNKEGKVIRTNPYRMVVDRSGQRFERPPGSGKWYYSDNTEAPAASVGKSHVEEVSEMQKQIDELKAQLEKNAELLVKVDAKAPAEPAAKAEKKG